MKLKGMKFGKEFAFQMIPEWQEAYLDYNWLKKLVKNIRGHKRENHPPEPEFDILMRSFTLYQAYTGLTNQVRPPSPADIENQVIRLNNVRREGTEGSETTFLKVEDEGGDSERMYFKRLDDEFFKVSKFYREKVTEVVEEAAVLDKQMNALIAFRLQVDPPNGLFNQVAPSDDVEASAAVIFTKVPSTAKVSRRITEVEEENARTMRNSEESNNDCEERKPRDDIEDCQKLKPVRNSEIQESEQNGFKSKTPEYIVEILKQVKLNNDLVTSPSTIKGFLNLPSQKDLSFSKEKLFKAEEQLRKAFVEFYQKLRLLKNYCFLNILAISKIMKKYDKIASRRASKPYMTMVDSSYLGTSDEVSRLMEIVETTFIKYLSNSNRSKGMKILRQMAKKERHRTTFTAGFLVGCAVSLILAISLIIRAQNILDREGGDIYMETMFPLYSLFGFIVLHMVMFAGNIYFWRLYRVNYSFIFGFKQGTELGYRDVLLVSFCIGVLALASVLANLDMEMDPVTLDYQALTELLPLGLVALLFAVLFCPFNIIYRSSRFFLLKSLLHCVLAPFYKVTLPDFMLADQLTSQVQALRSLQFHICYYIWGDYKRRQNHCSSSHVFISFSYVVGAIPFWWRLVQSLRRWFEEKDRVHAYNAVKYLLILLAVCCTTRYSFKEDSNWKFIALVTAIGATMHATYWDIVLDWGLLQRKSKNRWLRDKLLVPYKSVYFIAMVLEVLLRLAWMQTVTKLVVIDSLHRQTTIAIVACLEIIRRGIWNFFRLENEHLNNVGKFRAFKTVPLPFNYDDDEDKDD